MVTLSRWDIFGNARDRFLQTPTLAFELEQMAVVHEAVEQRRDHDDVTSGGARNPFKLYVYARSVDGLKTGFHHYAALTHDLGLIRAGEVSGSEMLAGQKWPAKASAIVFLVAHFPRTMWKYHMPMAYRIVMMEAGFICQNIALAATHHGLSAVPSGALKSQ